MMDRVVADLNSRMDRKRYCLIGTGGVSDGASAYRMIRLGASLVQVLTALVYEGPGVVRRALRELDALLARDGFTHVADAIGIDNPRENS
jgi:dihydroorotate dehydrogenase